MDNRYKTFWPRVAAALIDGLILLPVILAIELVYKAGAPFATYLALTLTFVVMFTYSIYLHGRYGQTVGKWVMKVQVLNIDEDRLSMRQAFLRDSIPISLDVIYLFFAIAPVFSGISPDSREFKQHIPGVIFNAGLLSVVLELLTMLTNPKRRSLHDYIAGSVVVRRSNPPLNSDAREAGAR